MHCLTWVFIETMGHDAKATVPQILETSAVTMKGTSLFYSFFFFFCLVLTLGNA